MWYGPLAETSASVRLSAIMREFQAVADVLATGCVMAGAHNRLGKRRWYMNLHGSRGFLGLPAALLLISAGVYFLRPVVFYTAGQTCVSIGIALTTDHFVRFPTGLLGRLLNSQFLRAVGILSCSLYLWQELFLDSFSPSVFTSVPQNLILTGAVVVGSYYLVERPALRLKSRFEDARRRSLEHADEIIAGATER
jgi:peptidoglycan/LPS O-acetylase OafA/YrhL